MTTLTELTEGDIVRAGLATQETAFVDAVLGEIIEVNPPINGERWFHESQLTLVSRGEQSL